MLDLSGYGAAEDVPFQSKTASVATMDDVQEAVNSVVSASNRVTDGWFGVFFQNKYLPHS